MKFYTVKWQVAIAARSPREAVQKVMREHFDPRSTATSYRVSYDKVTRSKLGPRPGAIQRKRVTETVDICWP
jgi:hypothetical protein